MYSKLPFLISNKGSLSSTPFPQFCACCKAHQRVSLRLRPSGFPVHTALGSWCCPHRGGRLAKRPWQRARWQHAIFLKVNNKTSYEPSIEATKATGVEESRRVPGAGKAPLQSSTFLAGTDQWFSFPQWASSSNHSWRGGGEEMGSVPIHTGLTEACYQELLALLG